MRTRHRQSQAAITVGNDTTSSRREQVIQGAERARSLLAEADVEGVP